MRYVADKTAQRADSTKSKYYVPKCVSQEKWHYVHNVIYMGGVMGKAEVLCKRNLIHTRV